MQNESFFVTLEYVKDNDDEAVEQFIQKIVNFLNFYLNFIIFS